MKTNSRPWVGALAAAVLAALALPCPASAEDDGIALAIVYDTSGSMREPVRDKAGRSTPKYQIANRALIAVAGQIENFATNSAAGPRTIHCALFTFQREHPKEAVPFGPFSRSALEDFARRFSTPNGNTPLGNTLEAAAKTVLRSPLSRKHVLIITDGLNTRGPRPEQVFPQLKKQAEAQHTDLSVHFVAFDIAAKQFNSMKNLGATVVGAADEGQLNAQLQFILQRKILLEEEEPPKTK